MQPTLISLLVAAALAEDAPAVRITDAAAVDTYNALYYVYFTDALKVQFTDAYVDTMVAGNDPNVWPGAMRTEKQRAKSPDALSAHVAYQVATLPNESTVVWIPADEYQGVTGKLRPEQDLFLMVRPSGLATVDGSRALPDGVVRPPPPVVPTIDVAVFGAQLDTLIAALASDFAPIRGAIQPKQEGGMSFLDPDVYASTVQLDGALSTNVWGSGIGATLFADYGDYEDPKQADEIVERLIAAVDAAPKPCCSLVKDRIVTEVFVMTYYLPFDPNGQMDPRLKNMVLEIEFRKGLALNASRDLVDSYSVGLRVHRQ